VKFLVAAAAVAALGASLVSEPADARSMHSMNARPTCAAGDKVVWVNTRSKVFYEPGGAYYGKTKHGKYVCESQAMSMGMHMAKGGMMSDSNGTMMNNSGMKNSGMMKHHGMMKDHSGMMNGGTMGSGSMKSDSMKPDAMKPGSMAPSPLSSGATSSGSNSSGSSGPGNQGSGSSPGPGRIVTPAPVVSASPSN